MKKTFLSIIILLLTILHVNGQEIFASATNKQNDGYVTLGFTTKSTWGLYAGFYYNSNKLINTKDLSASSKTKFGILKVIKNDKWITGFGVQPTQVLTNPVTGTAPLNYVPKYESRIKPNLFIGFNPLKSKDMKLWIIGNVVGGTFTPGVGLSYKLK